MAAAFDPKSITRNRTVGWGIVKTGEKAAAVTTDHLLDDDGKVNTDKCKAFGVDPAHVTYITIEELPKEYAAGPKDALTKLASEWSEGSKDKDGKPIRWTPDDVAYYLVLQSRMQDAANASIKQHRPLSDKALDRATSAMVKAMKRNGKTFAEIVAVLAATGMKVSDSEVREAFGA